MFYIQGGYNLEFECLISHLAYIAKSLGVILKFDINPPNFLWNLLKTSDGEVLKINDSSISVPYKDTLLSFLLNFPFISYKFSKIISHYTDHQLS